MFQQLADTLAPGQIKSGEFEALGMPDLGDDRETIAATARKLAQLVTQAANDLSPVFPTLTQSLRVDNSLSELPTAWTPEPGGKANSARLADATWVDLSTPQGGRSKAIHTATIDQSILGTVITFHHEHPTKPAHRELTIGHDHHIGDARREMLHHWAAGIAATGTRLGDLEDVRVPLSLDILVGKHTTDTDELEAFAESYHSNRTIIDDIVG